MPANGRWDLILHLKVNGFIYLLATLNQPFFLSLNVDKYVVSFDGET